MKRLNFILVERYRKDRSFKKRYCGKLHFSINKGGSHNLFILAHYNTHITVVKECTSYFELYCRNTKSF